MDAVIEHNNHSPRCNQSMTCDVCNRVFEGGEAMLLLFSPDINICKKCAKRFQDMFVEEERRWRKVYCNICGARIETSEGKELKTGVWFCDKNRKDARTINICKRCIEYFAERLKEPEKKTSVVAVREKLPKIIDAIQIKDNNSNFYEVCRFAAILPDGDVSLDWKILNNWLVKRDGGIVCYTPKEFEERFEVVG